MSRLRDGSVYKSMKYISRFDTIIFPLMIGRGILNSINVLIPTLLSAKIIDLINEKAAFKKAVFFALLGVSLIFLNRWTLGVLNKHSKIRQNHCFRLFNAEVAKKAVMVDFPQVESSKVQELKQHMKEDYSWGAGLFSVFDSFGAVSEGILSIIIYFTVLLPLFLKPEFYHSINSYIYIILFCVMTFLGMQVNTKYFAKITFRIMDHISKYTKLFYYFILDGAFDYKAGKDVRIYKTHSLILGYLKEQELSFMQKDYMKLSKVSGVNKMVQGIQTALIIGGSFLYVTLEAAKGIFTLGDSVKYATCLYQLSKAISLVVQDGAQFLVNAKRQESRLKFFDIPEVLSKGDIPVILTQDSDYVFEFRNVSFRYLSKENYVIKNISLTLRKGDCLAIVGMNGSGKTTFIKLLCRLDDPTEGEIYLNNINIKNYRYEEYLKIMAVVFQDFKLFSFSIGQNLAVEMEYDKDKAIRCLTDAGFEGRYIKLENGLETVLNKDFEENGVEISGGEAQKLAIARALYKDASIIILDEPTAALDPVAEFEIYESFHKLVKNRTSVFISHRLSSCRFCSRIVVFHEGRIVQSGLHEDLLKDSTGKYYELWTAQAQYYEREVTG